jgi:ribosomal protein S18 acetylase RimI-like enzyme
MEIVRATRSHPTSLFLQIADLHIQEIHHGALPLLGRGFMASMYRGIAAAPCGAVWMAIEDGQVAGFVAGSAHTGRTYRGIVFGRGPMLCAQALLGLILRPRVIGKLISLGRYMNRDQPAANAGPRAELLAIAVSGRMHHRGVGRALVAELEHELRQQNVGEYFVSTNAQEIVSNRFYRSLGFEPCGTHPFHALTLQEYRRAIGRVG